LKDDRVYLGHILRCISRIEEYTVEGREKYFTSPLIQDGVIRNLQTLAESSQRLSDDIKNALSGGRLEGVGRIPKRLGSRLPGRRS